MRTSTALRTLTAALFTGGVLAAAPFGTAGTAMAAAPTGSHVSDHFGHSGHSGHSRIRGTVVSVGELNVRERPTTHSPVVAALAPGSHGHVECSVLGQKVRGNPHWYWLPGVDGWASAVFIDTGGRPVPTCTDPCPQRKDHGRDHDRDHNDDHGQWSASGSLTLDWNVTIG
ncbi:hypothetical protein [Streptomyces graminilatus]|uniref:hypothetical protein n=1 Tax=Streptomyces graminilatus TaxID=1464070 RepID=UPI0006E391C1|nr:hypothetical protein [Streptomyces graminilatus]